MSSRFFSCFFLLSFRHNWNMWELILQNSEVYYAKIKCSQWLLIVVFPLPYIAISHQVRIQNTSQWTKPCGKLTVKGVMATVESHQHWCYFFLCWTEKFVVTCFKTNVLTNSMQRPFWEADYCSPSSEMPCAVCITVSAEIHKSTIEPY